MVLYLIEGVPAKRVTAWHCKYIVDDIRDVFCGNLSSEEECLLGISTLMLGSDVMLGTIWLRVCCRQQ